MARITSTATAVFGAQGYSRARITAICHAAGVSVGTFYDHFENKADLLLHVAELAHESFSTPGAASLQELEGDLKRIVASSTAGVVRAWLEAIAVEPDLRAAHAGMRVIHLSRFTEWVRDARAARGTRSPLGEETTARAVIALLKEVTVATYEAEGDRVPAAARAIWLVVYGE